MVEQRVPEPDGVHHRLRPPDVASLDRALCWIVAGLIAAHLLTDSAAALGAPIRPMRLSQAFSLNAEQGVGTWFASVQLATAALCAAATARAVLAARWWWFLALLLLAASIEEVIGLHEYLSHALGDGALRESIRYTWVLAGAPAAALLAVVFLGFIGRQEPALRKRLIAGGACFVIGAVVMELAGGIYLARQGMDLGYVFAVAAEEGLELIGGALVLSGIYRGLHTGSVDTVARIGPTG